MPEELFTMTGSGGLSPLLSYIFTPICPLPLWKIPQRQLAPLKAKIQRERNSLQPQDRLKLEHDARKLENDARTALLQAVGGLALLIGLYFTATTWRTTQEGQVTDRLLRLLTSLGKLGGKS